MCHHAHIVWTGPHRGCCLKGRVSFCTSTFVHVHARRCCLFRAVVYKHRCLLPFIESHNTALEVVGKQNTEWPRPTAGPLPAHCRSTAGPLFAHCLPTVCPLPTHCLPTVCPLPTHCLPTAGPLFAHCLPTVANCRKFSIMSLNSIHGKTLWKEQTLHGIFEDLSSLNQWLQNKPFVKILPMMNQNYLKMLKAVSDYKQS